MPRHTNAETPCPACEKKLGLAHPEIAGWFREKVKPAFPDCHISWSYRGEEDQEAAFLDGKTKLHWPLSPHNKTDDQGNPCALALDLFELDYNGKACWSWGYFRNVAKLCGDDILWGGVWQTLGDYDHYQLRRGAPHS